MILTTENFATIVNILLQSCYVTTRVHRILSDKSTELIVNGEQKTLHKTSQVCKLPIILFFYFSELSKCAVGVLFSDHTAENSKMKHGCSTLS